MHNALGPLKGYWMFITRISESVDGSAYLAGSRGAQAAQYPPGQDAEPHLHLIQPGGMSGCVVEVDQGMAGQPPVMLGLMSAQVVEDHMQFRFGMLGHNPVHEVQKLPAPAPLVVTHCYGPSMDFQGGKEGGGAVALVLMIMPSYCRPLGRPSHPRARSRA